MYARHNYEILFENFGVHKEKSQDSGTQWTKMCDLLSLQKQNSRFELFGAKSNKSNQYIIKLYI